MRRLVGPVLILALLAVPAGAATTPPRVAPYDFGTPSKVRPKTLGVGAKGELQRLTWSSWGGRYARGRGIYDIAGFAGEPGTGYHHRVTRHVLAPRDVQGPPRLHEARHPPARADRRQALDDAQPVGRLLSGQASTVAGRTGCASATAPIASRMFRTLTSSAP